ncbi:MAG: helix-turn-helix transcriptional regulator [Sciscionella sp.]|nr:helix-turn-helix transcriptional regulator [Sciscionella sp.]
MDVFEVVADPTRRSILDLLAGRERSAGELVTAFPSLSQPAVSRHLRVLRDVGLVRARIAGQRRMYSLRADRLAELDAWLDKYRAFWAGRLDTLEQVLDSRQLPRRPSHGGRTTRRDQQNR